MDGKWSQAEEPLHWLVDSPDPVHSGDPPTRAERSASSTRTARRGPGSACRSPKRSCGDQRPGRPDRRRTRRHEHGAVETREKERGGQEPLRVDAPPDQARRRQGDAASSGIRARATPTPSAADRLSQELHRLHRRRPVRSQPARTAVLLRPDRPVRQRDDPKGWNTVQDAQRRIPDRVPNTAVISVIDLELDDGIHVGTHGLKRLGHRLAQIALRELFGHGRRDHTDVRPGDEGTGPIAGRQVPGGQPRAPRPVTNLPGMPGAAAEPRGRGGRG